MASGAANYGGSGGYKIRFIIDAWEQQTDPANNRSLVYWNAYMYRDLATAMYNNDPTYGYVTVNGTQNNGQVNSFNFGVGQIFYMFNSGAQWVYHDAGGAKTVAISGYHNANLGSTYITTASVGTFYLTLTSFTTTTTTATTTSTSRSTSTSSTSSSTSISWTTSTSSTSTSTSSTSTSFSTSSTSSSTSQSTSTTTIRYGYQTPTMAPIRSFKPSINVKRLR